MNGILSSLLCIARIAKEISKYVQYVHLSIKKVCRGGGSGGSGGLSPSAWNSENF